MTSDDPVKTLKSFVAVCCMPSLLLIHRLNTSAMLQEDPDSRYIFDGQRNEPQTEICREGKKLSRKCIQVPFDNMNSSALRLIQTPTASYVFNPNVPNYAGTLSHRHLTECNGLTRANYQDQGFFCALPMDPARTHMECFRIPK
jgi:hypothetical protein